MINSDYGYRDNNVMTYYVKKSTGQFDNVNEDGDDGASKQVMLTKFTEVFIW